MVTCLLACQGHENREISESAPRVLSSLESALRNRGALGSPKDSFEAIFCLARLFEFSGVIFRDPPRLSFKTSIK